MIDSAGRRGIGLTLSSAAFFLCKDCQAVGLYGCVQESDVDSKVTKGRLVMLRLLPCLHNMAEGIVTGHEYCWTQSGCSGSICHVESGGGAALLILRQCNPSSHTWPACTSVNTARPPA